MHNDILQTTIPPQPPSLSLYITVYISLHTSLADFPPLTSYFTFSPSYKHESLLQSNKPIRSKFHAGSLPCILLIPVACLLRTTVGLRTPQTRNVSPKPAKPPQISRLIKVSRFPPLASCFPFLFIKLATRKSFTSSTQIEPFPTGLTGPSSLICHGSSNRIRIICGNPSLRHLLPTISRDSHLQTTLIGISFKEVLKTPVLSSPPTL